MIYTAQYDSLVGKLILASTEDQLIGLWLEGQKYFQASIKDEMTEECDLPVLQRTRTWLDAYFNGERPNLADLPLAPRGSAFRQEVWKILCTIPYGQVITYGDIAKEMAKRLDKQSMSAQAVGGAVGHNPISIIIPCHRVIGSTGSLTGYAGGIDKKIALLKHEEAQVKIPTN